MKMRKVIILFLILLASSESFAQGGWLLRNSGTSKNLRSIASAHGFFAVAVGDSGTVVNTETQGVKWQVQKSIIFPDHPFTVNLKNLNGVTAITDKIFCAVGYIDSIYLTLDGGINWVGVRTHVRQDCKAKLLIAPGVGQLSAICYDSASNFCTAVGYWVETLFSSDSGKHWIENYPNAAYMDFGCVSVFHGGVLAGTLNNKERWPGYSFLSRDQGDSWDQEWVLKNVGILGCSLLGWTLVGEGGAIYHSISQGITWDTIQIPTIQNINSVYFATNAIGYLCGDSGLIYFTTDGGYNWQRQKSPTTKNLRSIHMTDAYHGFICGDSGVILTTTNGGYTADDEVGPTPSSGSYSVKCYPNPARSRTRVEIFIPNRGHVRLRIYNMLGIEVATLADTDFDAGSQNFEWAAEGLATGIYICKMEVGGRNVVSEITLTK